MDTPHPLVAWLARKKLKPYVFADMHKIPRRTIYNQTSGVTTVPTITVMQRIEDATGGKVTVKKQIAWLQENGK